jgi:hypothetical protein
MSSVCCESVSKVSMKKILEMTPTSILQ